jgi:hypothetical protein
MNRDNSCQQDCRTQNIQRTSKVLTAWGHSLRHLWPQRVNGHPAPSSAPLRGERQAVNPPHAASCRAASVRQGIKCQTVCKPGSVPPPREHGRSFLLADRCRPAPATYPDIWGGDPRRRACTTSLFGLAPGGVYRAVSVAVDAVGSYPTLSPLPTSKGRRFAFCGTVPRVTPGGRYPPPFHRGARTFLDTPKHAATVRPSGGGTDARFRPARQSGGSVGSPAA